MDFVPPMTFYYGMLRVLGSTLAFLAGIGTWPFWWVGVAIAIHATGSVMFSRSTFADVKTEIISRYDDPQDGERWAAFYEPSMVRDIAMAFVKCGVAYLAGFWLAQVFAAPPPVSPIPEAPSPIGRDAMGG